MSNIGPGDLVVCVDDSGMLGRAEECMPKTGQIYTIRAIRTDDIVGGLPAPYPGVLLEEITNPPIRPPKGREVSFNITRFRPVKKSSIEIFRQIAANPREKIDA